MLWSAAYSPQFGEGHSWSPQLPGYARVPAKKTKPYCSTGQNPQTWKWKAALSPVTKSPSLATRTMPGTHLHLLTQLTCQTPIAAHFKGLNQGAMHIRKQNWLKPGKKYLNSSFKSYGKKVCEGDKGFANLMRRIWGNWGVLAWRKKGSEETLSLSTATWKESGCQSLFTGDKCQHERTWSPAASGEF